MCKAPFTEHQITTLIKTVEAVRTVKNLCREVELSESECYNGKPKYGGNETSYIEKVHNLEDENRRIKQECADLSFENRTLKEFIRRYITASS